jgi:RES domain-containing protein
MPRTWRLTTAPFADTAFTGDGARRYGGRWNPKGVAVVYTAGSLSLALLELLVQDQPLRARCVAIPVDIPDDLAIGRITPDELPGDWHEAAAREVLRRIGADWVARLETAVLAVPSAVIPIETNHLLNPAHADFGQIGTGDPEELVTDLFHHVVDDIREPAVGVAHFPLADLGAGIGR